MKKKELLILLVLVVVVSGALIVYYSKYFQDGGSQGKQDAMVASAHEVKVLEQWKLPPELTEISGNVFIDEDRMACIQDNRGLIYIYNLKSRSIESKIPFAGDADYEGLALAGSNHFFVLRSDGFLYEVKTGAGKPEVATYDLPLGQPQDTESLFYDQKNNRLLIGVKEKDLTDPEKKGVYAFDLTAKKMNEQPIFFIEETVSEPGKKGGKKKSKKNALKPSELAIHPQTGEYYVLNGTESELLILDTAGKVRSTIQLDKKIFPQPEGMSFSGANELYISSEAGKKGRQAIIARVKP